VGNGYYYKYASLQDVAVTHASSFSADSDVTTTTEIRMIHTESSDTDARER